MIAYTGRYRIEDGKVITKVEAAWNEAWVGGEQVRNVRFDGDRLCSKSPPMPHPEHQRQDGAGDRGVAARRCLSASPAIARGGRL